MCHWDGCWSRGINIIRFAPGHPPDTPSSHKTSRVVRSPTTPWYKAATMHVEGSSSGNRIVKDRQCRDVLFLIFFIAFWVGMLICAGVGFSKVGLVELLVRNSLE